MEKKSIQTDLNPNSASTKPIKNAAAVALGRLGGLKGGKARAKKLSAQKRAEIAHRAAMARWKKDHTTLG